jgi:hypothetical protein
MMFGGPPCPTNGTAKRLPGNLADREPFMIGTMKVSRRDFLCRHLLRDGPSSYAPSNRWL